MQKDAMTATRQRATDAALNAQSSADTTALLHSPTFATQHAAMPSLLAARHATTATPSVGMDAMDVLLSPDGGALIRLVLGQCAQRDAETVSKPLQKDAMTATRQRATAAAQSAQSSANTLALDSRLFVRALDQARHVVVMENVQALNHATMQTSRPETGAVRHVPLRWVTCAITTTGQLLLPSAFGRQATRPAEMAKHSGQRKALSISVTITTRQRATAALLDAQSSVDIPALLHNPTSAAQHAEIPSALATRHATTATPTMGMDAVQTASRLSSDGCALLLRAVGPLARKSAETESELPEKDAMTETRQLTTAAQPPAWSSVDTAALQHSPTSATQHVETPSSLAARHVSADLGVDCNVFFFVQLLHVKCNSLRL
jgi:hypothetical protein